MTSKFRELAEGIKKDWANFGEQADALLARREELRRSAEGTFARHREHLDDIKQGLNAIEGALHDLEGSNSKTDSKIGEGTGSKSGESFRDQSGDKSEG